MNTKQALIQWLGTFLAGAIAALVFWALMQVFFIAS